MDKIPLRWTSKSSIKNKIKFKSEGIHLRLSAASALYQGERRHRNLINKYLLEGLSRLQKAQTPISIQRASCRKRCLPYQELKKPFQRSGAVRGAGVCQCCWALLCTQREQFSLSVAPERHSSDSMPAKLALQPQRYFELSRNSKPT